MAKRCPLARYDFGLKGWSGVVLVVAATAWLLFRVSSIRTTLASEAADELKTRLRAEYAARLVPTLDVSTLSRDEIDPRVKAVLETRDVEIANIQAHGLDPVYVRASVRVAGKDPPDGKSVRYFEMRHSLVTGWRVRREISAVSWWLHRF